MADRRRAHRAAAASLTAVALLAGCGGDESPASADEVLTVEQALQAETDGRVRVRGTLIASSSDIRLCSAILESHPPQCGQPSLGVRGLDFVGDSTMVRAMGVRWTPREVVLVGEVEDGVLSVETR